MTAQSRPRRTPWARRIISTLILLLVIVGVVVLATKGVRWIGGILSAEHARTTQQATPKPVEILPCDGKDLAISLTPSSGVVDEGIGFEVAVSVENRGDHDCSVNTEDIEITLAAAGEDGASMAIWSPSACDPDWPRPLLLRPEQSWASSLAWNGHIYNGCDPVAADTGGATAVPGTYTLVADYPGSSAPQTVSIQVR